MDDVDGLPGPTDSWVTLGALARETARIRLGTLVTSATFRLPGPLAIAVAQVDQMSGGRVELGLGAGWYEAEHTAYGIPFPPLRERFDRLEEQLAIITGLWARRREPFSFNGQHYTVVDSPGAAEAGAAARARRSSSAARAPSGRRRWPPGSRRSSTCRSRRSRRPRTRFDARAGGWRDRPLVLSMAQTVACGRTDAEVGAARTRSAGGGARR